MPAKTTKSPDTEKTPMNKAAVMLGRSLWLQKFKAANPDATPEARKAAWEEVKETEKKAARSALRKLERSGLRIVEKPAKDAA